jgi:two-component system nitrogen regulation sensor histidine kinase NtrY
VVLKRFRVQIVIRVLFLAGVICLAVFLAGIHWLAAACAAALGVWVAITLVRYVEHTHRNLSRFLLAIRYADFSQSFSRSPLGTPFRELDNAFTEVIGEFQKHRLEKEIQAHYLETIVQHVGIGLLVYRPDGAVELVNRAAKRLMRVARLAHLDALESVSPELVRVLLELPPGQRALVRVVLEAEPVQLAIAVTEFKQRDQLYRLASLQDIHGELEEKETEAWQNLTRVLTHEIMNSMTPIASLAATASDMFTSMKPAVAGAETADPADPEQVGDIQEALQTIHKRSRGLMQFVQAYRSLTHIPTPHFQVFPVREVFTRMQHLMQDRLAAAGITLTVTIDPESLELTADPELLDQVLLNLLINAADAVRGRPDPRIELDAWLGERGRVIVQVRDNGCGITEEAQAKIFIPFFTTKKEGSGIGLSLSRRIMRLHRGSISVQSRPGEGAAFRLQF